MTATRHRRWLFVLMLAMGLGLLAQAAIGLWLMREDVWESARESGRNIRLVLRERLLELIRENDAALLRARAGLEATRDASLAPAARRQAIFGILPDGRLDPGVLLLDAEGGIVLSSGGLVDDGMRGTDRTYLSVHALSPDIGLFIGEPIRIGREAVRGIPLSRRIAAPDGGFGGVAMTFIPLERVLSLFGDLRLGTRGSVTLFRRDGAIIARVPSLGEGDRRTLRGGPVFDRVIEDPQGQFVATARLDGVRRLYTPGSLYGTDMLLNVAQDADEIEAEWRDRALLVVGANLGGLLLVLLVAWALDREMRRRARSEAALASSQARFHRMVENSSDIVVLMDADGRCIYVSPAVERVTGRPRDAFDGATLLDVIDPQDREAAAIAFDAIRAEAAAQARFRFRMQAPEDRVVWLEAVLDRSGEEILAIARDVTRLQAEEDALRTSAARDSLTGLANRGSFDAAIAAAWAQGKPLALLLLDLDAFKQINDRHGHQAGDAALRFVARTMLAHQRRNHDMAARLGGDEFALLLPETDAAGAETVAERLRAAVAAHASDATPDLAGLPISVSIGIAAQDPAAVPGGAEGLVAAADAALYRAKAKGRNRVSV
jgi:diguanylate cyclase (GGDEF)-like protein/PAS domain S-box-containing protein